MKTVISVLMMSFLVMSCGSMKSVENNSDDVADKHTLPPNTASNKYSKKRQGN